MVLFLSFNNKSFTRSRATSQMCEKYYMSSADHEAQIEVFYLPSYSPELNPDEYLNGNLKTFVHSGEPIRDHKDLESKTRAFMKTLIKRPAQVRNYFKHPKVAYAA
ncbi:MAG: transposase [Smithellaceae bacterium]|nr:MAG: hypothetical protein BWX77_01555 [Bacteroidetes bacterium ADurb.Bin090]